MLALVLLGDQRSEAVQRAHHSAAGIEDNSAVFSFLLQNRSGLRAFSAAAVRSRAKVACNDCRPLDHDREHSLWSRPANLGKLALARPNERLDVAFRAIHALAMTMHAVPLADRARAHASRKRSAPTPPTGVSAVVPISPSAVPLRSRTEHSTRSTVSMANSQILAQTDRLGQSGAARAAPDGDRSRRC